MSSLQMSPARMAGLPSKGWLIPDLSCPMVHYCFGFSAHYWKANSIAITTVLYRGTSKQNTPPRSCYRNGITSLSFTWQRLFSMYRNITISLCLIFCNYQFWPTVWRQLFWRLNLRKLSFPKVLQKAIIFSYIKSMPRFHKVTMYTNGEMRSKIGICYVNANLISSIWLLPFWKFRT